ncbi:MAG: PTS transporter subunit EIIC [Peptococcaceae bacterium]|jgi:PTS system beta-glucosides-specific IIC component|nr:PTS transporter subunit EIIC [Peptococcaceae bacterium]
MDYQALADTLLETLGGMGNIRNITYCMTRLRFTLLDTGIVSNDEIKAIPGVLGVTAQGGVYQIIIGTNVDKVYKLLPKTEAAKDSAEKPLPPRAAADGKAAAGKKKNAVENALELISSMLSPMIPAIMGAAFITIVLSILSQIGIIATDSSTYKVLSLISSAVYYFFPVLIAMSLARRLDVNPAFAVVSACFLLFPDYANLFANDGAVSLLGIPVMQVGYAKQIVPIVLMVIAQKYIERLIYKIIPKFIRTIVASGLILSLTIGVTILALGPFGALLTEGLNAVIYFVVDKIGWAAIPIIAFINPFMLGTGLGSAVFPIMLAGYLSTGYEGLVLAAALAGNAAQCGSGLAIAWRTKNHKLREVSAEGAVAALMGVTEPMIFSVHYKLKRTLLSVMIGSGVAAVLPGLAGVKCYALATGVLSLPAYLPGGMANFVFACLSLLAGAVAGFFATLIIGWQDPAPEENL